VKEIVKESSVPSGRSEYITDVAYTGNFASFLAPAWLGYIAVLNGHDAPAADRPFRYCELGCGKGVTTLILAALNPSSEFHACDINPAHIEHAERLCRAAGLTNVRFHLLSIEQMLASDLPSFDFIVAHGLYSWVPDPVRAQIRDFARTRLESGGLLFLSYNALPGWAQLQPIRTMLRTYASHVPGDSLAKARGAFGYARRLADGDAGYFRSSPMARAHLDEIAKFDIRYVAHEYLTPHGDPFWFADVEAAMLGNGLAYAGSLTPADNYPELMVPPHLADPLATASRTMFEMHHDFVANTAFRRDLYVKGSARPIPPELPPDRLAPFRFAMTRLPEDLPLAGAADGVRFDLRDRASAVVAIHRRLSAGPAHASDLHGVTGFESEDETSLLLQQFVVAHHLVPCSPADSPGWKSVNTALVDVAIGEHSPEVPLACPATGLAVPVETVNAALIEAAAANDDATKAAERVLARMRAAGHPVELQGPNGERRSPADGVMLEWLAAASRRLQDPASAERRRLRLLGILN